MEKSKNKEVNKGLFAKLSAYAFSLLIVIAAGYICQSYVREITSSKSFVENISEKTNIKWNINQINIQVDSPLQAGQDTIQLKFLHNIIYFSHYLIQLSHNGKTGEWRKYLDNYYQWKLV